jgi:hypothetical protein
VAFASAIGTTIEWYDLFLYGAQNGETIGRIYDDGRYVPADMRWFWSITAFHIDPAVGITTNGRVPSLD